VLAVLRAPGVPLAARSLLTSAYWTSGLQKLFAFDAATAEAAALGLPAPALAAALTILVQLAVRPRWSRAGRWTWLGAGALGLFTLLATLIAHAFWTYPPAEQARQLATFTEHLGLIGGLALAAVLAERDRGGRTEQPA
jgi:uncharacterized membrane protein YphA (DoxX/SURF4 family)